MSGPGREEAVREEPEVPGPTGGQFRRRESTLVLLNLAVLAALLLVHLGFSPLLGGPTRQAVIAMAVFFLLQTLELVALQNLRSEVPERMATVYVAVSVTVKLGFAFLVAILANFEDSHYAVLLVLPIVSAAFRFPPRAVAAVTLGAASLSFLELWIYFRKKPPVELLEFYEAATIVLIYVVVAIVVGYFAAAHRRDEARLRASLRELEGTRDRLVREEKLSAVGRLSGAIAHEIRNPVTMILSSSQLLRNPGADEELRGEMATIIESEARRLERLTTDFLSYARVREPERRETVLLDSLEYVASVARARALERRIRIEVDCPETAVAFLDASQIHQALLNLVANAIEAAPEGTRIDLRAGTGPGREATLSLENEGELPEAVLSRLFEPFFTTKAKGTGLGLAIARNIARAHGGDLLLARNGGGKVRFELRLPGKG